MPTYEYRCRDCGSTLEVVQSIHDAALTECPECQGTLRKVFGNVGVVFKGSGFYRTDNRSKTRSSGSEAPKAEPAKAETAKSETTKSESGSASKATGTSAGKSADSAGSSPESGATSQSTSSKAAAGAASS